MSKYKAGDKVVLEILSIDGDGYYIVGSENYSWWASPKTLDEVVEPLSTYTDQLNDKIKRQEAEITRLLAENAELKKDLEYYHTGTDTCDMESARAEEQEEAWKLARKCMLMSDPEREAIFGSGHNALYGVLTYFDYKHAAAKVAEWEQKKEEICVGDVLLSNRTGNKCIVTRIECELITTLYIDGSCSNKTKNTIKEIYKKIGHIDIESILEQIGGEQK